MLAFDKFSGKAISKAALDVQPDVVYTDTEFSNGVINGTSVLQLYARCMGDGICTTHLLIVVMINISQAQKGERKKSNSTVQNMFYDKRKFTP